MNQLNICWGLLGISDVTEMKSGPGLYKNPNSMLEGVYDPEKEKALRFAFRHGAAKVFESIENMLADPYIDIVYIAMPADMRCALALQCLEAGKAVYIENPLALTFEQALAIDAKAKEKKLPAYAALYRRGLPKFINIKELLAAVQIGDIRMIRVTHWARPLAQERQGETAQPLAEGMGSRLWQRTIETLDILEFYFGKMAFFEGQVLNQSGYDLAEDTVAANFRYENGAVGIGSWCYAADKDQEEIMIAGSKGNLRFSVFGKEAVILEKRGEFEMFNYRMPNHIAMPYQAGIVRELLDMGKSHADWEQALDVMKWIDRLYHKK